MYKVYLRHNILFIIFYSVSTVYYNVRQDLAEKDMDLRTVLDTIRDRGKWRHLVKTSPLVNI